MTAIRFHSAETPLPRPPGGWQRSRFRASYAVTLRDMRKELEKIGARNVAIIADLPTTQIRNDGWPYSSARPKSPGVTITFECKHGTLRYDCNLEGHETGTDPYGDDYSDTVTFKPGPLRAWWGKEASVVNCNTTPDRKDKR